MSLLSCPTRFRTHTGARTSTENGTQDTGVVRTGVTAEVRHEGRSIRSVRGSLWVVARRPRARGVVTKDPKVRTEKGPERVTGETGLTRGLEVVGLRHVPVPTDSCLLLPVRRHLSPSTDCGHTCVSFVSLSECNKDPTPRVPSHKDHPQTPLSCLESHRYVVPGRSGTGLRNPTDSRGTLPLRSRPQPLNPRLD